MLPRHVLALKLKFCDLCMSLFVQSIAGGNGISYIQGLIRAFSCYGLAKAGKTVKLRLNPGLLDYKAIAFLPDHLFLN